MTASLARIILRERQARRGNLLDTAKMLGRLSWWGGYTPVMVTTDGGTLCPWCVHDEWRNIVWAHLHKCDNGWRPAGYMNDGDMDDYCACDHCGRVLHNPED